ncbi:MAG: hypothetical protein WAS56_09320 [Saprospiraceae bacterium]|jgi:UPF0716 family protein affecting phage T7 exclusion
MFSRPFFILLSLVYIGIGIFIFVKKMIPGMWNEVLAVVFVAYGVFRFYRAMKME